MVGGIARVQRFYYYSRALEMDRESEDKWGEEGARVTAELSDGVEAGAENVWAVGYAYVRSR